MTGLNNGDARCANQFCVQLIRERREKTIEELEQKIAELTQSQSDVVVRDTEYAIKMVEDSIEYAYLDCGMSAEGRNTIWVNWVEVKKILKSYG